MIRQLERLADPAMWVWCMTAHRLVIVLPIARRHSTLDRFTLWLLPFAGYYAYHAPECGTSWRWSERRR